MGHNKRTNVHVGVGNDRRPVNSTNLKKRLQDNLDVINFLKSRKDNA
ncbi:hypothetical protein [Holzapfeliella floricola]|nr:hypothetical protein [Holzapfeliella floricola]